MKKIILLIICYYFTCSSFSQQSDFKHINFKKADSIATLYKNESLHNLPLLSYKLTYRLNTEVEKFRAIYFWVATNIKSDYHQTNKTLKKGKKYRNNRNAFLAWNKTVKSKFIDKLINDKKTICTGYAFLVKELCSLANIDCEIVNGYTKTANFNPEKLFPNHSWNAVKLNNKWYLCDATLASGYYFIPINTFVYDYNDGYFLTEPNLFMQNHYPEDKKWLLTTNNYDMEKFINAPYIYSETYKHKITPILPSKIYTTISVDENILFKFSVDNNLNIDEINLVKNNGWKETHISLQDYSNENGILTFKHSFNKKGLYDVHIKVSDEIIVSYTIKVVTSSIL